MTNVLPAETGNDKNNSEDSLLHHFASHTAGNRKKKEM